MWQIQSQEERCIEARANLQGAQIILERVSYSMTTRGILGIYYVRFIVSAEKFARNSAGAFSIPM